MQDILKQLAVLEKSPSLKLSIIKEATLEAARALDPSDWEKARDLYWSVYVNEELPLIDRFEGCLGVAQMSFNLGNIDHGLGMLHGGYLILESFKGDERTLAEIHYHVRLGWAFDQMGDFEGAKKEFEQVRQSTQGRKDKDSKSHYSTGLHFGARAVIGLATYGVDVEANIAQARLLLDEDIALHPKSTAEAFGLMWLARIDLLEGKPEEANKKVESAMKIWEEVQKDSGFDGHYQYMKGRIAFEQNEMETARGHFQECIEINKAKKHRTEEADALLCLAACDLKEGNKDATKKKYDEAYALYPYLRRRGIV